MKLLAWCSTFICPLFVCLLAAFCIIRLITRTCSMLLNPRNLWNRLTNHFQADQPTSSTDFSDPYRDAQHEGRVFHPSDEDEGGVPAPVAIINDGVPLGIQDTEPHDPRVLESLKNNRRLCLVPSVYPIHPTGSLSILENMRRRISFSNVKMHHIDILILKKQANIEKMLNAITRLRHILELLRSPRRLQIAYSRPHLHPPRRSYTKQDIQLNQKRSMNEQQDSTIEGRNETVERQRNVAAPTDEPRHSVDKIYQ